MCLTGETANFWSEKLQSHEFQLLGTDENLINKLQFANVEITRQLLIRIFIGKDSFPDKRIQRAKLLKAFINTHTHTIILSCIKRCCWFCLWIQLAIILRPGWHKIWQNVITWLKLQMLSIIFGLQPCMCKVLKVNVSTMYYFILWYTGSTCHLFLFLFFANHCFPLFFLYCWLVTVRVGEFHTTNA